jgi:hypothetical protein
LLVEGEDGLLDLSFEVGFGVEILAVKGVSCVLLKLGFPHVQPIDLVKGDAKWSVAISQQLHGLQSLLLQSVHNIYNQHCHIAKRRATRSKISKRLMAWSVNNQKAWQLKVKFLTVIHSFQKLF